MRFKIRGRITPGAGDVYSVWIGEKEKEGVLDENKCTDDVIQIAVVKKAQTLESTAWV